MEQGVDASLLEAVRAGDRGAFDALVNPHRKRLLAHCYRMLGAAGEAEDAVQEALLRAWRHVGSFEGRSSFRAWLYAIATRVCLDHLGDRPARRYPSLDDSGPADPASPPTDPLLDPVWLEALPDAAWCEGSLDVGECPEAGLTRRQSVAIAFLAAIHLLPGTQRAALLLLEVAGWSAAEVAEALDITVAAVNSAAQRARATLDERAPSWRRSARAPKPSDTDVLGRYARAWRTGDATLLASTLRDDATLAMPPSPAWYAGREAVERFLSGFVFAMKVPFDMIDGPSVNGAPSLALYAPDRDDPKTLRAHSVHVIELDAFGEISAIRVFMEPAAVGRLGLPMTRAQTV